MDGSGDIDDKYSLPDDWIYSVEFRILQLVPAYTLEMLDKSDSYRVLPFYFWDYRMALKKRETVEKNEDTNIKENQENIVYRDGKAYKKVNPKTATWANNIF